MLKNKGIVFLAAGFLFITLAAQAQNQTESRFLQNTASLSGNTGLWKVHTPITLPPGQFSFSVWLDRINRNPGQLTITTLGFGGSAGLTRWLELGVNFEVNRRVLVRRSDQLSLGQQQLGLFGAQFPGAPPSATQLMPGSTLLPQLRSPATPTGALTGAAGYYNALPFAGMGLQGNGIGTASVGLKFNVLSQEQGSPLDVGVRTYLQVPTHRSISYLQFRPTQTGALVFGSDLLAGKTIAEKADVYVNAGFRWMQSPDDGKPVELSHVVPLGFGLTLPHNARFQFMSELNSEILVGDQTHNTPVDAENVTDLTAGFRAFLNRYLNFSAGYRHPLNQSGGDKNGFVFQLGYTYGPPYEVALPSPPSVSCSADPSQVEPGQMVRLSAQATPSMAGNTLTYEWTTTGGTIQGSGQSVQVSTAGLAPGSYVATVRVTEQRAGAKPGTQPLFADCSTRFSVVAPPPPARPPTVDLSADRTRVQVGEAVNFTARGNSPDNRPLTYQWSTTGGSLQGSGTTARLDTAGVQPGSITGTVRVTDDRNLSAQDSETITVVAPPPPPPPPQTQLLDQCQFALNSARVDNVCKAKLDNIALRLQNESDATLAVVGFAAGNERNPQQLSQTRADNVRAYLSTEKGIAQGRLTSRAGAAGTGPESRRAEMHLVPRGATFMVGYNRKLGEDRSKAAQAARLAPPTRASDRGTIIATLR